MKNLEGGLEIKSKNLPESRTEREKEIKNRREK